MKQKLGASAKSDPASPGVETLAVLVMKFYPSSTRIEATFAASSQRGSPTKRSENYGNRSSNTGANPPNEAED
jgi:hypothetical protein